MTNAVTCKTRRETSPFPTDPRTRSPKGSPAGTALPSAWAAPARAAIMDAASRCSRVAAAPVRDPDRASLPWHGRCIPGRTDRVERRSTWDATVHGADRPCWVWRKRGRRRAPRSAADAWRSSNPCSWEWGSSSRRPPPRRTAAEGAPLGPTAIGSNRGAPGGACAGLSARWTHGGPRRFPRRSFGKRPPPSYPGPGR